MIIFDGKYKWNGRKDSIYKPVSWWPGSCRLTVIDISEAYPDVHILKPIIVLASETKEGYSVESRYEDLVKNVCRRFKLNLDKILWISYDITDTDKMKAAVFKSITKIGEENLFTVKWRPVISNELDEIKRILPSNSQHQ